MQIKSSIKNDVIKKMVVQSLWINILKTVYAFFSQLLKRGTHVITLMGISFHIDFKHTWKGNGLELLTLIVSDKNMQESNKNLKVMIKTINVQLFKWVVEAMTFEKINLTPPLKMRKITCWWIKAALWHSNEPTPKNLSKTPINVE